jgi:nucleoside-diphosphate-sugar epimerase
MEINNKTILITGARGFLGYHLARRLFRRSHTHIVVAGYRIDKEKYFKEGYFSDLTNFEECLKLTESIDYVFHFAAKMGGIEYITKYGTEVMTNNVLVNTNMIKAAVENGVEKFFFPSSFCVYPELLQRDPYPLEEDDAIPAFPDTFYGWEKLFTEQMLKAFKNKIEIRIARFVSVYGPEMTYSGGHEKSLPAICRKVINAKLNDAIEIWGNGNQIRSFVYIEDALNAIEAIMESNYNFPFNVSGEDPISINEIANQAILLSKKNLNKIYNPQGVKGVDIRIANIDKIKTYLGWLPLIGIQEGIEKTYRWIEKDKEK